MSRRLWPLKPQRPAAACTTATTVRVFQWAEPQSARRGENAPTRRTTSAAVWYRFPGTFSRLFRQIVSRSRGMLACNFRGLGGSSCKICTTIIRWLPRKGTSPVSSSKRITPSE